MQVELCLVLGFCAAEPQRREPSSERAYCLLDFESRKRSAQTKVRTHTEAVVIDLLAL